MGYILKTASGKFYTGKAGNDWLSDKVSDAFAYTRYAEAGYKVDSFNRRTTLHKEVFLMPFDPDVEQFVVMYRDNGQLACEARVFGPYSYDDAEEKIVALGALTPYDDLAHAGNCGWKYIQQLER